MGLELRTVRSGAPLLNLLNFLRCKLSFSRPSLSRQRACAPSTAPFPFLPDVRCKPNRGPEELVHFRQRSPPRAHSQSTSSRGLPPFPVFRPISGLLFLSLCKSGPSASRRPSYPRMATRFVPRKEAVGNDADGNERGKMANDTVCHTTAPRSLVKVGLG